jgi:hypothetical protein
MVEQFQEFADRILQAYVFATGAGMAFGILLAVATAGLALLLMRK